MVEQAHAWGAGWATHHFTPQVKPSLGDRSCSHSGAKRKSRRVKLNELTLNGTSWSSDTPTHPQVPSQRSTAQKAGPGPETARAPQKMDPAS